MDTDRTEAFLAKLWDVESNGRTYDPKTPSKTRVYWKCDKGHVWDTFFSVRNRTGCPYCSGNKPIPGENDLASTHPHLLKEWHPANSKDLTMLSAGSDFYAKWVCPSGHVYEMRVNHKVKHNKTCTVCKSFGFLFKKKAKYWHPTKNGDLTPYEVTPKSAKKVWWQCEKGHEWEARIFSQHVSSCPYCAGFTLKSGMNDFQTKYPEIVKAYWDFDKNKKLPSSFFSTTKETFFWKCPKGHNWVSTIEPVIRNKECLVCLDKKVQPGVNDLTTTHPNLIQEWHFTKNKSITPNNVRFVSTQKVWWQCEKGHEWQHSIFERSRGNGPCPYCSNRKTLAGFNDLATNYPHLASEWHPTKNNGKSPSDFTPGQDFRAWWQCEKGHEWNTTINTRTGLKSNCPICAKKTSLEEEKLGDFISSMYKVERHVKKIAFPYEIDIYIPERKIAIEYNGLYWHSEQVKKDPKYHYKKWLACKEKGIQLIQIWEDDWLENPKIVKSMLRHKLSQSEEAKVYARKTFVAHLNSDEAKTFLKDNHIQGFSSGSYYLGLKTNDTKNLVAVLVLRKEPGSNGKVLNIIRYATSVTVAGGFTRLLKYAERTYQPEKFITFSDHTVSDGGLYANNGFKPVKELPPDYMYVAGRKREHKFGYRLKRFRNDPELQYVEGYTEKKLADLNGLSRIWDAGKTKWERKTL